MSEQKFAQLCAIAGPVSRETFGELLEFEDMFRKWSVKINLAAASTLSEFWERHILDSVQLLPFAPEARSWTDLGSGGGFPGLPVAFLLRSFEGTLVRLVESNRKKASFLQSVAGQFDLPVRIHAIRIEQAVSELKVPDVVTARALAPLNDLLALTAPWLSRSGKALFHKGRDYGREIKESAQRWSFDLVEHRSLTDSDGVILEISNLADRSAPAHE